MAFPDHHDDLLAEAQMGFPHRGGTHTELCPPPFFFLKEKTTDLKLLHFWKLSTIHRRALCNVTPAMVCTPYNIVIVVILGNDPDDKVCLENLIKTLQTINF